LYQLLKSLVNEEDTFGYTLSGIDYGTVAECQEQYWWPKKGTEAFAANPSTIPKLATYYRELPLLKFSAKKNGAHVKKIEAQDAEDPFAALAPELLLMIVMDLPMASANCLRAASPAVARLDLGNGFWKQRLHQDMPWLYDLPDQNQESPDEELDWAQVYEDLLRRSEGSNELKIHGLVNRRRIWKISEQIARPYIRNKMAKDEDQRRNHPPILADAVSTPMRRLIAPEPAKTETSTLLLIKDFADLERDRPTLSVFWSSEGTLSGFGVCYKGTHRMESKESIGAKNYFAVCDDVKVGENDWVRGLILTTRSKIGADENEQPERKIVGVKVLFLRGDSVQLGESNGDQRFIHAAGDLLFIGVMAQWSPEGRISKLSLLQARSSGRSLQAGQLARLQADQPYAHSGIGAKLWKDQFPPPEMTLSEIQVGYGSYDFKADLAPMEALVLGRDEEELSAITEISCDAHFGAFEVRYRDGASRSIGPRPLTMKSLEIDGRGGERVVAVSAIVDHIISGLRLVTNRNRQLVIGPCPPGFPSEVLHSPDEGKVLRGLYCSWACRDTPRSWLQTVAIMSSPTPRPTTTSPATATTGQQDGNGFWWEPEPPPMLCTEVGPLYGQREIIDMWQRNIGWPAESAIATWLDCSRPVEKVKVAFTHPSEHIAFSPVSIVLVYSDGTIGSVGPTRLTAPTDKEGESGTPWCWCHYDSAIPESERARTLHYHWKEWSVGKASLDSIRLWIDGRLSGFQFVSTEGESPLWGKCEGAAAGVIRFGQGPGDAIGLKVFLDDDHRPVTYSDMVVVSIQALARK
jgi:hypothetical protein